MNQKYIDWVRKYEKSTPLFGKEREATKLMKEAFPELKIVSGHINYNLGERSHFWIKDPEGNVIDPTARQFMRTPLYKEFVPGKRKVGQCCNDDCKKDLHEYFGCVDDKRTVYYCSNDCKRRWENKVSREQFWNNLFHPDDYTQFLYLIIGAVILLWPYILMKSIYEGVQRSFKKK